MRARSGENGHSGNFCHEIENSHRHLTKKGFDFALFNGKDLKKWIQN
jgi:hypothetical protein